jgi:hypothetical protein
VCFDYSLRGHKEIDVGITLLIIVAGLIGIPIGMLVVLILALILIPIHIGGSGHYGPEGYVVAGWAKALAGRLGVVFKLTEKGGRLEIVMSRWVIWRRKEDVDKVSGQERKIPHASEGQPEPDQKASEQINLARAGESESPETEAATADRPSPSGHIPGTNQNRVSEIEPIKPSPESGSPASASQRDEPKKKPPIWARFQTLKRQLSRYWDYWQEARPILTRFMKRLRPIFGFRYIDIDAVYGGSDPAQTGRWFGYVEGIRPMLGKRTSLILTPDFTQFRIEGSVAIEVSLYLSRLLWALSLLAVRGGILGAKIWWRERRAKHATILREA